MTRNQPATHEGPDQLAVIGMAADGEVRHNTIKGGAIALSSQILRFLLQIGRTTVLAWLISPHDYGLIAMVSSVSGILGMVRDPGLAMATVMTPGITHGQVSSLFWVNAALGTAAGLVLACLTPLLAHIYGETSLIEIGLAYSFVLLASGLLVQHQALLRRQMRFMALAIVEVGSLGVGTAAGLLAAYHGAGYWALVAMEVVSVVVATVTAWMTCRWRPSMPRRETKIRSLLRFGGHLTAFSLIDSFTTIIDPVAIGWRWGPSQMGLYNKAASLVSLPIQQIGSPVAAVALPALTKLLPEPEGYRRALHRILQQFALVIMPGLAFMVGSSDVLIPIILGPQWLEAAPIFAVLGLGAFARPLVQAGAWVFMTLGRTGALVRFSLLQLFVYCLAILASLGQGALGVAIGIAVATWLLIPVYLWYAGRVLNLGVKEFLTAVRAPAIAAGLELGALLVCAHFTGGLTPLASLAARVLVALTVTITTLCLLSEGRDALAMMFRSLRSLKTR